jgi:hypothetical protein
MLSSSAQDSSSCSPSVQNPVKGHVPLTHQLTHQGFKVPCSRKFIPKYWNAHDQWLMATPMLHLTISLHLLADLDKSYTLFEDRLDWSKGGIYDEAELAAMEHY